MINIACKRCEEEFVPTVTQDHQLCEKCQQAPTPYLVQGTVEDTIVRIIVDDACQRVWAPRSDLSFLSKQMGGFELVAPRSTIEGMFWPSCVRLFGELGLSSKLVASNTLVLSGETWEDFFRASRADRQRSKAAMDALGDQIRSQRTACRDQQEPKQEPKEVSDQKNIINELNKRVKDLERSMKWMQEQRVSTIEARLSAVEANQRACGGEVQTSSLRKLLNQGYAMLKEAEERK